MINFLKTVSEEHGLRTFIRSTRTKYKSISFSILFVYPTICLVYLFPCFLKTNYLNILLKTPNNIGAYLIRNYSAFSVKGIPITIDKKLLYDLFSSFSTIFGFCILTFIAYSVLCLISYEDIDKIESYLSYLPYLLFAIFGPQICEVIFTYVMKCNINFLTPTFWSVVIFCIILPVYNIIYCCNTYNESSSCIEVLLYIIVNFVALYIVFKFNYFTPILVLLVTFINSIYTTHLIRLTTFTLFLSIVAITTLEQLNSYSPKDVANIFYICICFYLSLTLTTKVNLLLSNMKGNKFNFNNVIKKIGSYGLIGSIIASLIKYILH